MKYTNRLKSSVLFGTFLCMGFMLLGLPAYAQLEQVKPFVPPKSERKVPQDYRRYLAEAMSIHSMQFLINNYMTTQHVNKLFSERKKVLAEEQMNALTECNVKRLEGIYKNPRQAWQNMTDEYNRQEQDLKIYVNSAVPTQQQNASENAFPYWRLGRNVLIDVYQNPEKYGEMYEQSGGFKRWKDQDYIYTEQVNDFLTGIVQMFGVSGAINGISRNNSYEQNSKAYQTFLTKMKQEKPNIYNRLTEDMLKFPMPPKPLPPANEIIKLTQESSQGLLFPSMPEPWAYYIKNKKVKRLATGEMNEYYQPDSLRLRVSVGSKNLDNRFAVYQQKRTDVETTNELLRIHQEAEKDFGAEIASELSNLGISSVFNPNDLTPLKQELIQKKRQAIQKARELLKDTAQYEVANTSNQLNKFRSLTMEDKLKAIDELDRNSPEYTTALSLMNANQRQLDEQFINAMEKDINGTTMLTDTNSKDVEQLMKGALAQKELVDTVYQEQEKLLEKERMKKIDADCLNGGL